jgi:hypothetical protein
MPLRELQHSPLGADALRPAARMSLVLAHLRPAAYQRECPEVTGEQLNRREIDPGCVKRDFFAFSPIADIGAQ